MLPTTASACAALLIGICLHWGCRQETPQIRQSTQAAPASQANQESHARTQTGAELFKQYCSPCHPDGGNVSDPKRTLRSSALRKQHITGPEAIVNIMRHPISRMIRFDETTIPDKDALLIAEYVLKNFQ